MAVAWPPSLPAGPALPLSHLAAPCSTARVRVSIRASRIFFSLMLYGGNMYARRPSRTVKRYGSQRLPRDGHSAAHHSCALARWHGRARTGGRNLSSTLRACRTTRPYARALRRSAALARSRTSFNVGAAHEPPPQKVWADAQAKRTRPGASRVPAGVRAHVQGSPDSGRAKRE